MLKLSKRMQAITDWIEEDVVADIGCDHAYVICKAVLDGKCVKGYACDIAQSPLNRARRTIEEYGLEDYVEPRLQNGLVPAPSDLQQAVITGMGGKTIIQILEDWLQKQEEDALTGETTAAKQPGMRLLLSPHSDVPVLRQWLMDHDFFIEREQVLHEDKHWYFILDVVWGNTDHLEDAEILYGKNPVINREYQRYLDQEVEKWSSLLGRVPVSRKREIAPRLKILRSLQKGCEAILNA